MNLSTQYLGLELAHPILPGACPLSDDLDGIRRLEDAGAPAIVLPSLFEERIDPDKRDPWGRPAGAARFGASPDEYLEKLRRAKASVRVPVIASLNGDSYGRWLRHGELIEQAGADALELNVYHLATDPSTSGQSLELEALEMVGSLKRALRIPIAVKLSPYYTSLAHFARDLDVLGVDGLVLFNRFIQADIDVETMDAELTLQLSNPSELLLRLAWISALSGQVQASLAASGGVHDALGAVKALLAGASVVQVVSALLERGPRHIEAMRRGLAEWMERRGIESVEDLRGKMAEGGARAGRGRADYMQITRSWR